MKFRISALAAALALLPAAAQAQGAERLSQLPLGTPAATDVIPFTRGYTGPLSGNTYNVRVGALLSVPGSTQYMPFSGGTFTGPVTFAMVPAFNGLNVNGPLGLGQWTTAARPASPAAGATGWNVTLAVPEWWNGSAWQQPCWLSGCTITGTLTAAALAGNASGATTTATGASTARTLASYGADRINPENFGATMTGTTNDSAAFNAARIAAGSYTPIFVPPGGFDVPTAPTGGTSNPLLWEMSGNSYGTSTNNPVLSLGNADSVQTFFSGTWFLGRENSPADANPVMRVDLDQSGTGGTGGNVVPGIQVNATQGAGSVTSLWGLQVILNSHAASNASDWPEPVALQASVTKTASAPLWGSQLNLNDTQDADTATAGGMIGLEVGYNASGTDSADSRRLLDLVFNASGANPAGVIGTGIYLRGLSGETLTHGLRMSGNITTGIDLTGATLGSYAYNDGHTSIDTAGNVSTSGSVTAATLKVTNLPTSCTGQATGVIWNNSGALGVCP